MLDVAIIGGGISGLMAAERISAGNPSLSVALFEKGRPIEARHCPIVERRQPRCVRCKPCAIMEGAGGAGAFSDGKYVISTEYGGWLTDVIAPEAVMGYIEQADGILCSHGATTERFKPDNALKTLCLQHDMHMQQGELKHLGTDANLSTMENLINALSQRVELRTGVEVTGVDCAAHEVTYTDGAGRGGSVRARHIVFAVGRSGSEFFQQWCRANGIAMSSNQVDIGVRVELPSMIWEHFSHKIYEPKIWYRSKLYGDVTRMFCFNERGQVVTENTGGILTVNGHAYKDEAKKSGNSNFALLSTLRLTQPFNEPIRYAKNVATLANQLSGGSVLVQRLGDLEKGRRTDDHRLKDSTTRPTLDAAITATFSFTVVAPSGVVNLPTSVNINRDSTLTHQLSASISPSTASQAKIWSSSEPTIATVNSNGLVTIAPGVKAGTTTITVKSAVDTSKTATCIVRVFNNFGAAREHSSIAVDETSVQNCAGFALQINEDITMYALDVSYGASVDTVATATIEKFNSTYHPMPRTIRGIMKASNPTEYAINIAPTFPINPNEYRVALRVNDRQWDIHYMIQLSDGTWAEKRGGFPSTHFDSGTNPSTFNWTGGYNSDVIYFAVSAPW
ncbi:hypothetical protein FACS1894217_13980 [Clostridia bacterium]|nr:hypothetical protein FACS1894217_13980 [Clostridia bacterium]